jgi:putative flippase GtrA
MLRRHWRRFGVFGTIGFTVFLAGLVLQVALVRLAGMGEVTSYVIKTLASVQLSLLLNRYLTWRDRDIPMIRAAALFNVQQLTIQGIGVAAYAGLVRLGVGYIVANVAITALLTPVGYVASHLWSLASRRAARPAAAGVQPVPAGVTFVPQDAEITRPLPAVRDEAGAGPPRRSRWALLDSVPWSLVVILAAQATMSLRLMWTNTAFLDEATYLFAGHVEIAHWLHGSAAPAYATYFSGAPVLYPPLAALAASAGGLIGARLLSMAFMLGATALLWGVATRLFGRWAGFLGAALFAALGPTQFLGAFATYDAMSLFLLTAATWCVVASEDRDDSTLLLIAGAALLALANATKYASMLFDPTIVALGALAVTRRRGVKAAVGRGGLIAAITVAMDAGLLALGGSPYFTGLLSTTVSRAVGGNPASVVLTDASRWIGIACIPAAISVLVVLARRRDRVQAAIVGLLAVSGVLAPLNQARIHTTTSLSKHVDFGAWFAAIAAGFLIMQFARISRRRWAGAVLALLASAAVLVPAAVVGRTQSGYFFQTWPNSSQVTYRLQSLTRQHQGHYLTEDYDVPAYYLQDHVAWWQWSDTWFFAYTPAGADHTLKGLAAYQAAIQHHYFSLVILDFGDTANTDRAITADIRQAGTYHVIAELPYWDKFGVGQFTVWMYQPRAATALATGRVAAVGAIGGSRERRH